MPGIPEDIHLVLVGKRTNYTNQIDEFIKTIDWKNVCIFFMM